MHYNGFGWVYLIFGAIILLSRNYFGREIDKNANNWVNEDGSGVKNVMGFLRNKYFRSKHNSESVSVNKEHAKVEKVMVVVIGIGFVLAGILTMMGFIAQ